MRLPHAPAPLLSPTGRLAAASYGRTLGLVHTGDLTRRDLEVPDGGRAVAFAADDQRVALLADGRLAVTNMRAPKWDETASVACPGAIYRAALGKKVLVAAIRTGDHTMNLGAWRISEAGLEPMGAAEGLALGASAIYHLHLDEANDRVLLGGISGRGAFEGDGKPFTGIVELSSDLPLIWKGGGLPFRPEAYLYPLDGGQLAIAQRNRLARIDLSGLPNVKVVSDVEWETPLERVALSPDGKTIAWMWAEEGDVMQLRTAKASNGKTLSKAQFELAGNFPALAVDDDGVATAVAGQRPDLVHVVRVDADSKIETNSVTVPSEPD